MVISTRGTGALYVAWRQFSLDTNQPDAMMIARSTHFGLTFSKPYGYEFGLFDQKTAAAQFRTNAFPAMAIPDGLGRIYMAWAARGSSPPRVPYRAGPATRASS